MQTLLSPPVVKPKKTIDFPGLMSRFRFHLSPLGAKIAVICFFTVLWLFVALAGSYTTREVGGTEASSLTALAKLLHQGSVSGRDFQSIYGPGMQILVSIATSMTKASTPRDASGMVLFFFSTVSALLIAVALIVCDRFSWTDCAIVYGLSFFLNLFFGVLDFRIALLLLGAVLVHRITAAEDMSRQVIWATATGLLCFTAQLITFELGIYEVVLVAASLMVAWLLTRDAGTFLGIEVVVATLAAANIALVVLFKLTSANYELLFDYQNYSLEILRGYHNGLGTLWQLPVLQTVVLLLAAAYAVTACIVVSRRSSVLDAPLYLSLALAGVIWLKTALVNSDVPHIVAAFTPMIVVIGILGTRAWEWKPLGIAWAVAVCALILVWPSFNLNAARNIVHIANGQVRMGAAIRNLYAPKKHESLPTLASLDPSDRNVAMLTFPFDDAGAGIGHPLFAPILESYAAGTAPLEKYYLEALEKQRAGSFGVLYGLDATTTGNVQGISRTPRIFEYVYRHFELTDGEDHTDGHYRLRARRPTDEAIEPLEVTAVHGFANRGLLTLPEASTCGLVQLQLRIEYAKNTTVFRPSGVELRLSDGDQPLWEGSVTPIEFDESFVTYISPLPAETFHKVFGRDPIPSRKWNKIEYWTSPADMLGSGVERVRPEAIRCVDPQKFVEAAPPNVSQ